MLDPTNGGEPSRPTANLPVVAWLWLRTTSVGFEYTFFAEGALVGASMLPVTSGLFSSFMVCSSILFTLYPWMLLWMRKWSELFIKLEATTICDYMWVEKTLYHLFKLLWQWESGIRYMEIWSEGGFNRIWLFVLKYFIDTLKYPTCPLWYLKPHHRKKDRNNTFHTKPSAIKKTRSDRSLQNACWPA